MEILSNSLIHYFPIEEILIRENRQRQEFNMAKLLELAKSIQDTRLMTPISLETQEAPYLVAGERRLKAITALHKKNIQIKFNGQIVPHNTIPVVFNGELTELEREELELDENLKRENLTWQEQAAAIQRLVNLRGVQHEQNPEVVKAPTNKTIAKETEKAYAEVATMRQVAAHLDDPDVAKAKTPKEAQKIIQRKAKEELQERVAASIDVSKLKHVLFHGDCREFIKTIPDNELTCIVTDPPYGIDMHKDKSWDGTDHEYDDTEDYAMQLIEDLLPEMDRCTQDEAHIYLSCDYAKFEKIKAIFNCYRRDESGKAELRKEYETLMLLHEFNALPDKGTSKFLAWMKATTPVFEPMYFPIIWNKGNVAAYPKPDHWPRKSYECILYAIKGQKKHNGLDLAVININQIQNQDHPAGKPTALYKHLLQRSVMAGDSAADFFVGQGNFFNACHELKLLGYGSELSDKYINLAKITLDNVGKQ